MAILKAESMAPQEETRESIIERAIISDNSEKLVAGVKCIRGVSPLVMVALIRANNPFVTGQKGFDAAGIAFSPTSKTDDEQAAQFGVLLMPKTAEVLACFSCDRQTLRLFSIDSEALKEAALDILEDIETLEEMAQAMVFVTKELSSVGKSQVVKSSEDEKPEAEALGKKKLLPTG